MMNKRRFSKIVCGLILVILTGCATVPMTDRRQLTLVPAGELNRLSVESYGKVLKESTLSTDPKQIDLVQSVGKRLAAATEKYLRDIGYSTASYDWEFKVIKDDEKINAWCLPGGKVAVYTGILPITKNENGLAVILGHEIAHAIANHGNERMTQSIMVQLGGMAVSEALKNKPEKTRQIFQVSYGVAGQVGVLLPYSRLHESESDRIGLIIMSMAGYDPREAVSLWERMDESRKVRIPDFISTHPSPVKRIENIKRYLPEAMGIYRSTQ